MPLKKFIPILLLAALCSAETYDASYFKALKWRSIGPLRGGRSITSAGSDARPLEYFFGAVGGGLWKTTDGGTTWKPVTDGQIASSSVGAVAVSPSNPDILYIGMGEVELRGNIMQGDGIYRSTDAGKTWNHAGLADSQTISRIRIHPTNPDIVYVASFGHPYGPNQERGIFRTRDGGKTWKRVLFRNDRVGAADLSMDPNDPSVLFASLWDANRTPWSLTSGGPGSGLFKTTDGGETWKEITRNPGLPQGVIGKIGVSISGGDSSRVYAIVEAEDGGVYQSNDAGNTWTRVSEDRRVRQRAFYYSRIYTDPKAKDAIYILNTSFFKSIDGGKTYKAIPTPHGDNHDLWIASNDTNRMINSNDGGGNVSVNGGATWTGQAYPTAQLYHIATTKDVPYHVCGAQQDNSTICVSSEAPRGGGGGGGAGRTSPVMYAVGGGESGYIAPDPKDPNYFYAGSQGALLTKYDRRSSWTRDIQVYPLFFSGQSASTLKERWQWTFPIVFSPQNPNTLYTTSQHLWRTTNDGQSWERISPDLTRADPKTLGDSGGPITKDQNGPEIYATIFTVAPSFFDANTIWTGSDDGYAHITRDGGKNWTKITPQGLPDFARISLMDASHHKPGTAYLAAKQYQLDDRRPYLYKTSDFGKSWTKIVDGIPANAFTHAIRADPKRAGLLYAGTEHGIYVSFDDGAKWQSLNLDLPDTQVSDIVVEENDLVIATHGRSFYVLDGIAGLRQMNSQIATAAVHLFAPANVVRSVMPANFDYYLKAVPEKLTIEILDSKGALVRSFVATPEDDKKKPSAAGGEDEDDPRGRAPKPPTRLVGLNRFTWDLRYPGAKTFEGMVVWSANPAAGPMATPGKYQVRLTANGETKTVPLEVLIDPRLRDISQKDLEEQFQLASQVRDAFSEANEMVIRIRAIKKQIKDRNDKAKDPAIAAAGERLETRLSRVEEEVYQVRNRSNQDPLNFQIKLNNLIGALARSIMTGDARPTDQAYVVFKELSERLAAEQAKLKAVLDSDLKLMNDALAAKGQAVIQLP